MTILDPQTSDLFFRLIVAVVAGMLIGLERFFAHKTAGMRTYALVAMGSALFIIISEIVSASYLGVSSIDPIRMASQIVVGVGFLGAGMIVLKGGEVTGLTSATGLWVAAGIGMAAGFGLYSIVAITTFLTIFIFTVLWFIEDRLKKLAPFSKNNCEPENHS